MEEGRKAGRIVPLRLRGMVVHGRALGKGLGFPTANVELDMPPALEWGVYGGSALVGESMYKALVHIGKRPTVDGDVAVEAHLLDFDGDLYGRELELLLEFYLRGIEKFADLEALKAQMERDKQSFISMEASLGHRSSHRFFANRHCQYYPCHSMAEEINCLFCYCPFYSWQSCPGSPEYRDKQGRRVKNCSGCVFPHRAEHYPLVVERLRQGENVDSPSI